MNELTQETETGPGDTAIAQYAYTYRADGLKATETDDFWFANPPQADQNVEVTNNISDTYDALDRLIDEAFTTNAEQILGYDSTLPSNVQQWENLNDEYTYDLDSNMVGEVTQQQDGTTETTTSTYDANDRLVEQVETTSAGTSGSSTTTTEYTYNDTEQTSETAISGTPSSPGTIQSSQQYQYNLQGQMSGATVTTYTGGQVSQVEQLTYGYDTNGNRISALDQIGTTAGSWTSQTLIEYLNDSNNATGYSQVLQATQSDPTTGQIQQVTQYAIGTRQISQTTTPFSNGQAGTPTTLTFGYDGHDSVRVLINAAGAVATVAGVRQIFNYDAYGNVIGFDLSAAATTLLYNAQETDVATGLQYLRARYYNPASGSFTSLDLYAGNQTAPLSYNKYLYTLADPENGADPTGATTLYCPRRLLLA